MWENLYHFHSKSSYYAILSILFLGQKVLGNQKLGQGAVVQDTAKDLETKKVKYFRFLWHFQRKNTSWVFISYALALFCAEKYCNEMKKDLGD